jgi:hypothetical protein
MAEVPISPTLPSPAGGGREGAGSDKEEILAAVSELAVEIGDLQRIIDGLRGWGYRVIGPRVQDGAIIYDTLTRLEELPLGWTDRQGGGRYRLERRGDGALFGYAVGPHSWRRRRTIRPRRRSDRKQARNRAQELERVVN